MTQNVSGASKQAIKIMHEVNTQSHLATDSPKYGGNINIIGAIGGAVNVNITDGSVRNEFFGKGFIGGVTLGVYGGELYTDDVNRLYRDTISWAVVSLPNSYIGIYFFDGYSRELGSFQAGGISVGTLVVGGGTGGWQHKP